MASASQSRRSNDDRRGLNLFSIYFVFFWLLLDSGSRWSRAQRRRRGSQRIKPIHDISITFYDCLNFDTFRFVVIARCRRRSWRRSSWYAIQISLPNYYLCWLKFDDCNDGCDVGGGGGGGGRALGNGGGSGSSVARYTYIFNISLVHLDLSWFDFSIFDTNSIYLIRVWILAIDIARYVDCNHCMYSHPFVLRRRLTSCLLFLYIFFLNFLTFSYQRCSRNARQGLHIIFIHYSFVFSNNIFWNSERRLLSVVARQSLFVWFLFFKVYILFF